MCGDKVLINLLLVIISQYMYQICMLCTLSEYNVMRRLCLDENLKLKLTHFLGNFPGGPVVRTSPNNARECSENPGQGARISQASGPKTKT